MKGLCASSTVLFALLMAPPLEGQTVSTACPWPGPAQFLMRRASPPDSTQVRIGETRLKICYSRPSARDRKVMGGLVQYDRLWRTGANEPTVVYLTAPAEVAGVRLDGGRYLLLSIPRLDEWTLLFHIAEGNTPQEMFTSMVEHGRGVATVDETDTHVETLTIYGIDGDGEGAVVLEWERTRVRIPVRPVE